MHDIGSGHRLAGTLRRDGLEVQYRLEFDAGWAANGVQIEAPGREVDLRREGPRWCSRGGEGVARLDGCLDVVLDFTPATLAPHFRRLGLAPFAEASCDVVLVTLATLVPERARSLVRHLDRHHWEHQLDGRSAQVHLGAQGLVVEHDAGWTALAVG